jgi:tRNA pseudouridine38-40 synthase
MHVAAQSLVGEHDFTSFRAQACQARHAVREILDISVSRADNRVRLDITANGFLYHMVRNIAGNLLEIGTGARPADWMASLLARRDRTQGAPTAPPQGLYFMLVRYPDGFGLPETPADFPRGRDRS